jgi:hypothetical protein
LRWPAFVDYYYGKSQFARLYTLIDDDNEPLAVLGCEYQTFQTTRATLTLGFGSNSHAFYPGAGAVLFQHYLHKCDFGIEFGGTEDAHRVLRQQNWKFFPSVPLFHFNRPITKWPGEPPWKRAAKTVLSRLHFKRNILQRIDAILKQYDYVIEVEEHETITSEMLPRSTPFTFRFSPSLDHLNWRYNSRVSFVRYRIFRIRHKSLRGFVVINQQPHKLIVAHCDGEDPRVLALGILAAIRTLALEGHYAVHVALAATHQDMQQIFLRTGFHCDPDKRPFAIGSFRNTATPPVPDDQRQWLISLDIGDNGLRPPFVRA